MDGRVSIASVAAWIPEDHEPIPPDDIAPALPSSGLPSLRVESLPVAKELAAAEMAVLAARDCLQRADWDASRLDLLIHAWTYHQGHDVWPVVHYIADQIGASPRTNPVGLQQFCNGGLAGMHFAATTLLADDDTEAVLVTTGERFCEPGWQRREPGRPWGFGDSGTAALLTRTAEASGGLRLLSITQTARHAGERAFRGEDAFTPAPMWHKTTIDAIDSSRMASTPMEVRAALRDGPRQCLARALDDAKIDPTDPRLRWVALPRIDQLLLDVMYAGAFDHLTHAEPVIFGTHTGHLGSGDTVANLIDLQDHGLLQPGQIAVIVSVGAGWTWSTALFEAADRWSTWH